MKYTVQISPILFALTLMAFTTMPAKVFAGVGDHSIVMFFPPTDWPPYLIDAPEHPEGGVFVDVLKATSAPLGYAITVIRLSEKRGWEQMKSGEVNVYATSPDWVEQPEQFLWTDPFMENEDILLYRKDSPLQYTSPESLTGKSVAAIKGFIYPTLEPYFKKGKILRVNSTTAYTMLELLAMGRVDAAIVNKDETLWLFRNQPGIKPERFRMDKKSFESAWYRYAFPKGFGWETFIELFNKNLETMKQDGSLKAILDQYR